MNYDIFIHKKCLSLSQICFSVKIVHKMYGYVKGTSQNIIFIFNNTRLHYMNASLVYGSVTKCKLITRKFHNHNCERSVDIVALL